MRTRPRTGPIPLRLGSPTGKSGPRTFVMAHCVQLAETEAGSPLRSSAQMGTLLPEENNILEKTRVLLRYSLRGTAPRRGPASLPESRPSRSSAPGQNLSCGQGLGSWGLTVRVRPKAEGQVLEMVFPKRTTPRTRSQPCC